jgi:hypothetical protein
MSCVDERLARFPPYQYNFRFPMGINRIIKLSYPFMPAVEPTSPHLPQAPFYRTPQSLSCTFLPLPLMSTYAEGANSALQLSSSCQGRRYGHALCNFHHNTDSVPRPLLQQDAEQGLSSKLCFSLVNSIGLLERNS